MYILCHACVQINVLFTGAWRLGGGGGGGGLHYFDDVIVSISKIQDLISGVVIFPSANL